MELLLKPVCWCSPPRSQALTKPFVADVNHKVKIVALVHIVTVKGQFITGAPSRPPHREEASRKTWDHTGGTL